MAEIADATVETTEVTTPEPTVEASTTEGATLEARLAELESKASTAATEAITERKKRQQAEARIAEFEAASLSDKEKAEARATEAEARAKAAEQAAREMRIEVSVKSKASALNFQNPSAAFRLIDTSGFDLEQDVDKQAEEALKALAGSDPYLLRQGASATNGQTRTGSTPTSEDYERMSDETIAAFSPEETAQMLKVLSKQ